MEDFSINFLYGNTDKNKTNNSHHKTLIDNVFYTKVKRNIISKKYSNSTQLLPVPGQYRSISLEHFAILTQRHIFAKDLESINWNSLF